VRAAVGRVTRCHAFPPSSAFSASRPCSRSSTPAWLAANVRVIERVQAKWLNQTEDEERISTVSPGDAAAALRNVTALLGRHVRRERDEGTLS
jgi:hypothetical protein